MHEPANLRSSGEYDINMDLREVGYDTLHWVDHAQDRVQWRDYVRTAKII